jgi:hypothetical protein
LDGRDITKFCDKIYVSPVRPNPEAPQNLSAEVKRAFLQAERARINKGLDAAGAMYRKALDVGTKQKAPDLAGLLLAARLRKMEEQGMLNPDVAEWAKHVRLLGNDAADGEDELTHKAIEDLANLTRMALIYLYEMPERKRLMRENSGGECPPFFHASVSIRHF